MDELTNFSETEFPKKIKNSKTHEKRKFKVVGRNLNFNAPNSIFVLICLHKAVKKRRKKSIKMLKYYFARVIQ